ncbi:MULTISPECIES: Zn-ribbon domain-containing OB-fold protein [Bradyrhizobium]|uniref:Zn-ribbon domain-containing OB-fold protein n=1 Tax=Bradyrhizobium xenonodulans TaxID=2736875 RepID=UPI00351EB11D
MCDVCLSTQFDWIEASGETSIAGRERILPSCQFSIQTSPYVLVTVDLEEGPRMNARLRCDGQDPAIGTRCLSI